MTTATKPSKYETRKINEVFPFPENPKEHDLPAIMDGLKRYGQYKPIVVNRGTETGREWEILAGNGTHEAARTLGWTEIDCTIVDVNDVTARKILAWDNRSNELAGNDEELLAQLLTGIKDEADLLGTGFTEKDLERLLKDSEPTDTGQSEEYVQRFELVVECRDEAHQETLFARLKAEGETCRLLTL